MSQEGGVFIVPEDQREELEQALYENAMQQQSGDNAALMRAGEQRWPLPQPEHLKKK